MRKGIDNIKTPRELVQAVTTDGGKTQTTMLYILDNPSHTLQQIMAACKASTGLISKCRRRLRNLYLLPGREEYKEAIRQKAIRISGDVPYPGGIKRPLSYSSEPQLATDLETRLAELSNGKRLTPVEMAEVFTAMILDPSTPGTTRVQAINGLRELDRVSSASEDIGPGPPLTREDCIQRLSILIEAMGPEITNAAATRARTSAIRTAIPPESTPFTFSPTKEPECPLIENTNDVPTLNPPAVE